MSKYLLDTNVFLSAFQQYYSPDFAPTFWRWLRTANQEKKVYSIDMVLREMQEGSLERKEQQKQLHGILDGLGEGFFLKSYSPLTYDMANWINAKPIPKRSTKRRFLRTDLLLIANAKQRGCVLVTLEIPAPRDPKQIKIPDVCEHFGVECINTFEMLRRENLELVLRPRKP